MTAATLSRFDPATERRTMIDSQLRTVGINDETILGAMNSVPRENFVPAPLRSLAYADAALEVAPGRFLLEPMVLGLLLQHACLTPADRVLVVGAATGYSAAVITHIGAAVTALESDPALTEIAAAAGIESVAGPLTDGWAAAAPYDLILFEGSIEIVPAAFAAQLAPNGRVAAVVRTAGVGRATVGTLTGTRLIGTPFLEVAARPLLGFTAPRDFVF